MLKNYFKIAWVSLFRNKIFSVVNILGLALGMACVIFILLWVRDELTFDKDQKNYDAAYKVMGNRSFNNQVFTDENIAFPLANALQSGYPQITNAVATSNGSSHIFSYRDKKIKRKGLNATGRFFDMFTCRFIKGDPHTAIKEQSTMVLTQSTADIIFGNEDPIGKTVTLDGKIPVKITAVIADPRANSSFGFEYIEPYEAGFVKEIMNEWRNSFSCIYIQTVAGATPQSIDRIINKIMREHAPEDNISSYFIFPMSDWHLKSDFKDGVNAGGMIGYVRLFAIIAVIILITACINFMNLSTARSEKKAKEVGVRKTLGAGQKQLILQFFCESVLLTLIAFGFAVAAVYLFLPSFNNLVGKKLALSSSDPFIWTVSFSIILFTGLAAGSYPALYLSSFNPVKALRGPGSSGKKALLPRRILVTSQFVVSILLISATLIVYKQILHIKNRPTGYASENLIMIESSEDLTKNFNIIKQELLKTGAVEELTRASSPVTEVWWYTPAPKWKGKPEGRDFSFTGIATDADFAKAMHLKVLQGKFFSGTPADSSSLVLNKTAVDVLGLKDPVGMQMIYGPGPNPDLWSTKFTVIGVVDDIVMESPYKPVSPLMIMPLAGRFDCLHARLNSMLPLSQSLKKTEEVLKKYDPDYPFTYRFINEEFNRKFLTEELIGKLTNIFAGIAIFICCIGLAGLTAFTIEKRTREIGVRKVLGATFIQLVTLIAGEFIRLAFIAFLITIPITWLLMNKWLQNYSYHISISIWLFIAVGLFTFALTLAVVLLNTFKTVNTNPTKNLRTE